MPRVFQVLRRFRAMLKLRVFNQGLPSTRDLIKLRSKIADKEQREREATETYLSMAKLDRVLGPITAYYQLDFNLCGRVMDTLLKSAVDVGDAAMSPFVLELACHFLSGAGWSEVTEEHAAWVNIVWHSRTFADEKQKRRFEEIYGQ